MHMRILGMGPNWIRNWNLSWTWTAWLWTVIMQLVIGPWMTVFLALFCSVHKNSLPVSSEGIKCLLSLLVSCATEVENQVCICDELHMLGSIVQKLVRCILAFFRPSIHVVFIFCIWNQEGVVRPCSAQYEVKGFCMCVAIPMLFQYGQLAKQPRPVLLCAWNLGKPWTKRHILWAGPAATCLLMPLFVLHVQTPCTQSLKMQLRLFLFSRGKAILLWLCFILIMV